MRFIDSHCHIDAPEFDADREQVIARAAHAGVLNIVAPAVSARAWPHLKVLAQQHSAVAPAFGLHPMFLHEHHAQHLEQLRDWIITQKPNAIGECGLDHFTGELDPHRQRDFLIPQLKLAREFNLPVILHARKALDEILALIRRIGDLRGVVHSFSGSPQQAQQLTELGFSLGIGGTVTFERAQRLRGIVKTLPIESLLLETDAPDQPDASIRGQRNEPAQLVEIARVVSEIRGEPIAYIAQQTYKNAAQLFGLNAA